MQRRACAIARLICQNLIAAVIISLFLDFNVTKDRDCSIELLELLSIGLGGRKMFFDHFQNAIAW